MSEQAGFLVSQPNFAGSLSELAYALRSRSLAPEQLDLYRLVRSYLSYFEQHAADLELATEALPRLAQVVELKIRLLLPRPVAGTALVSEEELLEETLEAVALLEELEEAIHFLKLRRLERRLVMPARARSPDYPRQARPVSASPSDLARLAGRYSLGGYFELALDRRTLQMALKDLLTALKRSVSGLLFALVGARDWPAKTLAFAAMLELVREGKVSAQQAAPYAPIKVRLVK